MDDFVGDDDFGTNQPKSIFFISPEGSFRTTWDMTQMFILLYLSLLTPYRVAFNASAYGPFFWLEFLIDLYFWIDLVLNFFTGYTIELEVSTVLVSDLWKIGMNYAKTWLLIDIMACLPVDLVSRIYAGELECSFNVNGCSNSEADTSGQALKLLKLLRIFRLLKLLRLLRVSRIFKRYENKLIYYASAINMWRCMVITLIIAHWVGCVYGMVYTQFEEDATRFDQWILCIYWAVQSLTSVGYGDVSDLTAPAPVLVGVTTMLIGVFLCAWLMTNVLNAMNPVGAVQV